MTPQQQQLYSIPATYTELEELLKNHTTVRTLSANMLEADDLIAGLVSRFPDDKVVIISADGDYKQLLKYDNVTLINPIDDKQVFWMTLIGLCLKCIRGDTGDNVKCFPQKCVKLV